MLNFSVDLVIIKGLLSGDGSLEIGVCPVTSSLESNYQLILKTKYL